jgi:hypothetical protein
MNKPFVEKPVDADNHDVWIYYPHSMGGGVKMMFRKVRPSPPLLPPLAVSCRDSSYLDAQMALT